MSNLKCELVDEKDRDYVIEITTPEGEKWKILIPKEENDETEPFGLNRVFAGHYY